MTSRGCTLRCFCHRNIMAQPVLKINENTAGGISSLAVEYTVIQEIMEAQPSATQRFLELKARTIASALSDNTPPIDFQLPHQVVVTPGTNPVAVPQEARRQITGGLLGNLMEGNTRAQLRSQLSELEGSGDAASSTAARLLRWAIARHMIYDMLPAGCSVVYEAEDVEAIPNLPVSQDEYTSTLTEATDAIAEEWAADRQSELLVPYVPYARCFYLPQWVAFDSNDHLIVRSTQEAQSALLSMQRVLEILHGAVALAPYVIEDPEYQRKRYGMLGQLVNQGRALARYQTREIIETIRQRAAAGELNRGLSLSLPYFDDQDLKVHRREFQVIPSGRIMFIPGFVARAAEEEQVKVAQDTRLSLSTRKHLLTELDLFWQAFQPAGHR
jgi:hypothetical protein